MSNRLYRLLLLLCATAVFAIACGVFYYFEYNGENASWQEQAELAPKKSSEESCLAVPLISEDQLVEYGKETELPLKNIFFNDLPAAIDNQSKTLFISLAEDALGCYEGLSAKLEIKKRGYELRILDDKALNSLADCAENGNPLTLLVFKGRQYMPVNVVLTTLPVVSIEGKNYSYEADYWLEFSGTFNLWDPLRNENTQSALSWHRRGGTTMWVDKRSWKLSLLTERMESNHCDLLGLGADDDWILNPLYNDELNCRERMSMRLWNGYATQESWNYPMSTGEYVELILNNEYQGIYMLQRRVDEKYLSLNKETDIVLKSDNAFNYEIVYSPYDIYESVDILNDALAGENGCTTNIDNFVDVSLFLDYLTAYDNLNIKNMFYLLKRTETGYELYYIPWDTDMSLGIKWDNNYGFVLKYKKCLKITVRRIEHEDYLQQYPELDDMMARRWQQLRKSMYADESVLQLLNENLQQSAWSAAMKRDELRWGLRYKGEDSYDALSEYCLERLKFLDEFYA